MHGNQAASQPAAKKSNRIKSAAARGGPTPTLPAQKADLQADPLTAGRQDTRKTYLATRQKSPLPPPRPLPQTSLRKHVLRPTKSARHPRGLQVKRKSITCPLSLSLSLPSVPLVAKEGERPREMERQTERASKRCAQNRYNSATLRENKLLPPLYVKGKKGCIKSLTKSKQKGEGNNETKSNAPTKTNDSGKAKKQQPDNPPPRKTIFPRGGGAPKQHKNRHGRQDTRSLVAAAAAAEAR